jgi:hypothetical protein
MLANMCKDFLNAEILNLYSNLDSMDYIFQKIREADIIVMSGPSYINTYPADTVYLLEQLKENPDIIHNQSVYGIIQGGMPYVHTHESGLKMLECFCKDCNMVYKGGFVLGFGALLNGNALMKHPNGKKVERLFGEFLQHIANNEESPARLYYEAEMKLPLILLHILVFMMNNKIRRDLKKKGIDYKQSSPYLNM